jgi:hypothetical protein
MCLEEPSPHPTTWFQFVQRTRPCPSTKFPFGALVLLAFRFPSQSTSDRHSLGADPPLPCRYIVSFFRVFEQWTRDKPTGLIKGIF